MSEQIYPDKFASLPDGVRRLLLDSPEFNKLNLEQRTLVVELLLGLPVASAELNLPSELASKLQGLSVPADSLHES